MKKEILKFILVSGLLVSTLAENAKAGNFFGGVNISTSSDSLKQLEENVRIRVYPNPVQENFLFISLASDKEANYTARIYNLIGRVVEQKAISKGQNSIDLSEYKQGIYFVDVLEDGKTIQSMKIIRE